MEQQISYDRLVMLTRTSLAMLDVMQKILWELFDEELAVLDTGSDTDWDALEKITCALVDKIWPPEDETDSL